jgi:uncharacterized membrane protein
MEVLTGLIAASVAFVGSHFAMSHPLRRGIVSIFGEKGFQVVYSVVSFATMGWMYLAFKATSPEVPLWSGFDDISWAIGSALALLAMVLLAGSIVGNPALPAPGAAEAARKEPQGAFRVTRHPMMWGFALWAVSHMIAAPTGRTLVVALAILILALVGAHFQDGKKEAQMGEAWQEWESKTSYWPRLGQLSAIPLKIWAIGAVIWLAASWTHIPAGGGAAGVWRWLG